MKLFEIVDMNINFKSFICNTLLVILFGGITSTVIPLLNHFVFLSILNFEVEKWFAIGLIMGLFGIYFGMCLQKSRVFEKEKQA